jgi:hypothetical protein
VSNSILGPNVQTFRFDASVDSELFVGLPGYFILVGLCIYLMPQAQPRDISLTLAVGDSASTLKTFFNGILLPNVESGQWVRYDMDRIWRESSQFPLTASSCAAVRFIEIMLSCPDGRFDFGNIKFEVMNPQFEQFLELESRPTNVKAIRQFKQNILSCPPSKNFRQLFALESFRFQEGISDFSRNEMIVEWGQNPFLFDLAAQMFNKSKRFCPFCGALTLGNSVHQFRPLPGDRRIFCPKDREKPLKIRILCESCAQDVASANWRDVIEGHVAAKQLVWVNRSRKSVVDGVKIWQPGTISLSKLSSFLVSPDALDLTSLDCLLKPSGGNCRFDFSGGPQLFLLAFPAFAQVQNMTLLLNSESEFDLELRLANGQTIEAVCQVSECQRSYQFMSLEPTQSLLLIFRPRDGSSEVELAKVDLFGELVKQPPFSATSRLLRRASLSSLDGTCEVEPQRSFVESKGKWNSKKRIQTFEFKKPIRVQSIVFRLSPGFISSSLIVAFFNDKMFLGSDCIILPELQRKATDRWDKTDVMFRRMFSKAPCDHARVFYLDRLTKIDTHSIMFW